MFGIGAGEFIIILIVGLIVFGPSKLPEVGRAIGKGLREFRKAQAALSQTLNEPLETDKEQGTRNKEQVKNSSPQSPVPSSSKQVTADDVINLAKESPIVKESSNEKVSNDNPYNAPVVDARASVAGAAGGSDGTDKQSKPPTN